MDKIDWNGWTCALYLIIVAGALFLEYWCVWGVIYLFSKAFHFTMFNTLQVIAVCVGLTVISSFFRNSTTKSE